MQFQSTTTSLMQSVCVVYVRRRRWWPAAEPTERTRVKTSKVPKSDVYAIYRR